MKKLLAILLCLVMVLGLAACGGSDDKKEETTAAKEETTAAAQGETTAAQQETAAPGGETAAPGGEDTTWAEIYTVEQRSCLQGLISPANLVDRSAIPKGLPVDLKDPIAVGCSTSSLNSSFFVEMQNSLVSKSEEYGYDCSVLINDGDPGTFTAQVDTFITQDMDAVVLECGRIADSLRAAAENLVNAGIPVCTMTVPNDYTVPIVTAVNVGEFNNGMECGKYFAEKVLAEKFAKGDVITATAMFGKAGHPISDSKVCGMLSGMILGLMTARGEEIVKEDAYMAGYNYPFELTLNGSIYISEIDMDVKGYGEGSFSTDGGLKAAEDLFTMCPDMDVMFCDNDFMAIGAIMAAQAIGLTLNEDVTIYACTDGSKAGMEYVKTGEMFCTGANSSNGMAEGCIRLWHKIFAEGWDANDMPVHTIVDCVVITQENVDQWYNPDLEMANPVEADLLTTQEALAKYGQ